MIGHGLHDLGSTPVSVTVLFLFATLSTRLALGLLAQWVPEVLSLGAEILNLTTHI
jgi:hypothetical protein